ncbi:hypothetical protein BT67DRAFT_55882 [Trichocladium antarcticum]|uniref:RRM domain-containing protein n=1 Tax=Trichocladium antarcticum TaxID=1450529 RepID=A0AAN6UI55_9PEZI|nr:hypothetical protein BT67DRAFT_55882 [Trichocladium antarcticum]
MAAPMLLSRKANGVNQSPGELPKAPRMKAPAQGEKVVVRRLPPGLTEDEFVAILGDEWMVGRGKVDWFSYWPGKVSQHPSKPSLPSRAYLHVIKRDQLTALLQTVQSARWEDAKETYNDPALVSAPTVEFSIYKKVPGDKKRVDGRQGTIDQDPEFMAFLEGLANPDANKEPPEGEEDINKGGKTTTTPLIEYLRERKAVKAKEAAAAKTAKHARQDSHGVKGKAAPAVAEDPKKRSRDGRLERERGPERERPRESVKILTKKAAAVEAAAEAAKAAAAKLQSSARPSTQEPPTKSRRAGIAAAARILQRDLGLSPGNAHRKARQEAAKVDVDCKATVTKETPKAVGPVAPAAAAPAPPPLSGPSASPTPSKAQPPASGRSRNRKRGTGEDSAKAKGDGRADKAAESSAPAPTKPPFTVLKKKDGQQTTPSQSQPSISPAPSRPSTANPSAVATATTAAPPTGPKAAASRQAGGASKKGAGGSSTATGPVPTPGATRAFVKLANHAQGVTEALLREALAAFGPVTAVEIDRKKGFAYADFAEHAGLARAMAASPVAVAQASVLVLERKEMGGKRGGGGSSAGGGGGGGQGKSGGGGGVSVVQAPAVAVEGKGAAPATPTGLAEPFGAAAAAAAEEKTGGEQQASKRGGRRRGARARDRDSKEAKESGPAGKEGAQKKGDGGGASAAAAAAAAAS